MVTQKQEYTAVVQALTLQGRAKANQKFVTYNINGEMKQGSKITTRRAISRHLMAIFFSTADRKSSETQSNAKLYILFDCAAFVKNEPLI